MVLGDIKGKRGEDPLDAGGRGPDNEVLSRRSYHTSPAKAPVGRSVPKGGGAFAALKGDLP